MGTVSVRTGAENTAMWCREMIGMKRECKASCPTCKTTFSVPGAVGIGNAKIVCPNRKCRVRLEVEMGSQVLLKAKWIGRAPDAKRTTI